MKRCPTCDRTFPDDTIAFCLVDGSILSAPYDPAATQESPVARDTNPPATVVLGGASRDSVPPTQQAPRDLQSTIVAPFQPQQSAPPAHYAAQPAEYLQYRSDDQPRKSSVVRIAVIGLAGLGVLFVALFAVLLALGPLRSRTQNTMPRTADTRPSPNDGLTTLEREEAKIRDQLRTDPDNAELNRQLAENLRHQGKIGSEQYARRAVGLNPNSSAMHYTLVEVLLEERKKAEAEAEKKVADKLAARGK